MPTPPVVVRELAVPIHGWPRDLAGLRIAHVSDFHFHRWNETLRDAQRLLVSLDYDFLVATGDFGNFRRRWRQAAEMTRRFFEPLAVHAPIYAVLGNHDDPQLPTFAGMPLVFLRNSAVRVQVNGAGMNLAGVEQTRRGGGDVGATLAGARPDVPTIVLAHFPSTVFCIPRNRIALVLSGHTHGGQIRLPWVGCVWPNDRIPRRMACGLHDVDGTKVHISAGIGASLPLPVRINCPPELSVLTLVAAEIDPRPGERSARERRNRRSESVSI